MNDDAKKLLDEKDSDGTMLAPVGELLGRVLESSMAQTQSTTEWVMDALRKEATALQATLTVIRAEIQRLHSQPYGPNPDYVLNALLYPDPAQVAEIQKDLLRDHWSHGNGQR